MVAIYIGSEIEPDGSKEFPEYVQIAGSDKCKLLVEITARLKSAHDIHVRERNIVA